MFSDVLKIIPKLENKDMQAMEKQLQGRFTRIAKNFGKGIKNVMMGGGVVGAALALVDKVLNPLKEVQEAIDRTLKTSDDLATNAAQFNTQTGKLFKLVQLAKSTGLDQDNLFQLITKFQTAVAEARNNPQATNAAAVRNFTGEQDTVEGFFQFIQSLQRMEKGQQVLVQQAVFGEKQILRMADFLQQDFPRRFEEVGLGKYSSDQLSKSIEKLAGLNDMADALTARREVDDIVQKSRVINEGMIRARHKSERIALEKENQRIQSYKDLRAISDTTEKISTLVDSGVQMLGKLINTVTPGINKIVEYLERFSKSSVFRGLFRFGKGD